MLNTRSRSLAAIAAGALLLAPLAGCGGDDEKKADKKPDSSSTAPAEVAEGGESASAGSKELAAEEKDGDEVEDADEFLDGLMSRIREEEAAHVVMELGSSMSADADVSFGKSPGMHMTMTAGGTTVDAILLGKTMYIRSAAGQKYIKFDSGTPGAEAVFGQLGSFTPDKSLGDLRAGVKKIVDVGSASGEDINEDGDEELTKYVLTVDTTKLTNQAGEAAGQALPKNGKYALYVDEDGLLRAIETDVSGQKVLMKFSDWGKKVDLKAPPANQVSDGAATP